MLYYAHVSTKIGFVRRFCTDLTLVATLGNPFITPSITIFRQSLLRDLTRRSQVQLRLTGPSLLAIRTSRFKIRDVIRPVSTNLPITLARNIGDVLLRQIPPTSQNIRFLNHDRIPPAPFSIEAPASLRVQSA